MPAHRKPPGARIDNRKSRRRAPPPEVKDPIGNAPDHLTADEVKCWQEITHIAPEGLLTIADRHALEILCTLLAEFRADSAGFTAAKYNLLIKLQSSFGLSPAARNNMNVRSEPEKDNPFAQF